MVTVPIETARQYWILILFRGIIALLFGIMAIISVEFTLLFLVYLFGAYVLIDGILAIIVALQERKSTRAWLVVFLIGIVGIVIGILSFIHPGNVALLIFYLVALWLIIAGLFGVISSLLRASGTEWLSIIGGILSIIVGIVFFIHPTSSILSIVWLLGVFALVYGIIQIIKAFQVKAFLGV
jgi:uncharacterized membrane protein HdeD (DUF308 family)